jgi:hypothetical protein
MMRVVPTGIVFNRYWRSEVTQEKVAAKTRGILPQQKSCHLFILDLSEAIQLADGILWSVDPTVLLSGN